MSLTQTPSNEQLHGAQNQAAQYAGLCQARVSPEEYARQVYAQHQAARQLTWPNRGLEDQSNAARYLRDAAQAAQHQVTLQSIVGISIHSPAGLIQQQNTQPAPRAPDPEPKPTKTTAPLPEPKQFGLMSRFARKPKVSAI